MRLAHATEKKWAYWTLIIVLGVAFDIAYRQMPLYWSAQNIYFLPAFAQEGFGFLENDWQAGMRDPFPVFTLLVRFTLRTLHEWFFYAYHAALVTAFFWAITRVIRHTSKIDRRKLGAFLAFSAIFIAVHSNLFQHMTEGLTWNLHIGIAGYRFPGKLLVPSVFWAFVFVSIALFLDGKPYKSIASLAVALLMHPTFAIPSAAIVSAYLILLHKNGNPPGETLKLAGFALLICSPNVLYTALTLTDPTSDIMMEKAQNIIVHKRIPHHTLYEEWVDGAAEKLLLIGLALVVVRHNAMRLIMGLPLAVGIVLSIIAVATEDAGLMIMTPWRVTVLLAPLSLAIIIARGVEECSALARRRIDDRRRRHLRTALITVCVALIAWCTWHGGKRMAPYFTKGFSDIQNEDLREAYAFIKEHSVESDLYMIRPEMGNYYELLKFRLETGVPILVDQKTHPFEDLYIVEWWDRLTVAELFYDASKETRCDIARKAVEEYGVTHFLDHRTGTRCREFTEIFDNDGFRIYQHDSAAERPLP